MSNKAVAETTIIASLARLAISEESLEDVARVLELYIAAQVDLEVNNARQIHHHTRASDEPARDAHRSD